MPQFTKEGKPIGYVIGVTPGFARAGPTETHLRKMGLARKLAEAARYGFEFAMVDFEELGEAFEPRLTEQIKLIKNANKIELGVHLPYWMDLTIAYTYDWRIYQENLRIGTLTAADCGAKFVLFHSSSHARPNVTAMYGRVERRDRLVGPDGTNLGDWIVRHGLKDWFMAKFIRVLYAAMGAAADPAVVEYFSGVESFEEGKQQISREYRALEERIYERWKEKMEDFRRRFKKEPKREMAELLKREAEQEIIDSLGENYVRRIERVWYYATHYDWDRIFDYWRREGSEAEEYVAYLTVAKWMYEHKDPIWESIVETKQDPYDLCRKAILELGESAKLPEYVKQIVAAVAGKYIEGHLFTTLEQYAIAEKEGEKTKFRSIYDFCKERGMMIYIETAMPEKGAEGELRLIRAVDHVKLCKAIDDGKHLNYCMDFEHLLVNLIDPIAEAKELYEKYRGYGRYISCVHINAPRPLVGAHAPIEVPSPDLAVLYKWLYYLKLAGMKNAYLIWEMGSYGVEQSAIAFRNLVRELSKEPPTPPEKLPPEFYGITRDFEARTLVAVRRHAFDPLRGLLVLPEKFWGMLSQRAKERGRLAEWESEEYR